MKRKVLSMMLACSLVVSLGMSGSMNVSATTVLDELMTEMTAETEVETGEPAGTEVETGEPAGTEVETEEPAGTEVETGEPAGTGVETGEPAGTGVETEVTTEIVTEGASGSAAVVAETEHYTYRVNEDGATVTLEKVREGIDISGAVVIPSELGGYPVTRIDNGAFQDCTAMTSVVFPESLISIGNSAFSGCTGLTSLEIPDNVTTIGVDAFASCWYLEDVKLGANVTTIDRYAFFNCIGIKSMVLGDKIETISDGAFFRCAFESITIPSSVKTIGNEAFMECNILKTVYFKGSQQEWNAISKGTGNEALTGAKIYYNVSYVGVENGYEYIVSDGMAVIIGVTSEVSGNLVIPTVVGGYTVTAIGEDVFRGKSGLDSITLPSTISEIGANAFAGCYSLTGLTLYKGVKTIGEGAFSDTSISEVYFYGASEEWKDITIGNSNTVLDDADMHYVSGNEVYEYEILADGSGVALLKRMVYDNDKIEIPETIDGYKVVEIGTKAFADCTWITSVSMPSVTRIGKNAFYGCTELTEVNMPNVTEIGENAFEFCENLKKIDLSNITEIGGYALSETGLKEVDLPKVTELSQGVFSDCVNLTKVNMPNVVTIGDGAFAHCEKLESVDLSKVTSIGWSTFAESGLKEVDAPNLTTVTSAAFEMCKSLTKVNIPKVTTIENSAFMSCENLTEVNMPNLTSISSGAFYGCSSLVSIDCSELTRGGYNAFVDCESLVEVNLPKLESLDSMFSGCTSLTTVNVPNITQIFSRAFGDCTSLKTITLPVKLQTIYEAAFAGSGLTDVYYEGSKNDWERVTIHNTDDSNSVLLNATMHYGSESDLSGTYEGFEYLISDGEALIVGVTEEVTGDVTIPAAIGGYPVVSLADSLFYGNATIKSVVIPDSVKWIGKSVFSYCSALETVTMGDGVVKIESYAFEGCASLKNIRMSKNLVEIGYNAFSGCVALTSVILPDSLTTIGGGAFNYCSLEDIVIPDSVTTMGSYAFCECGSLKDVIIGNGITVIKSGTFMGCTSIEELYIPSTIIKIEEDAFSSASVDNIYYEGSESDWEAIEKDSLGSAASDETITMYYNYHMHHLSKVEALAPTHEVAGNIEHFVCSGCDKLFSDVYAMTELSASAVVIEALGHEFGTTYATDADNHWQVCECGAVTEKEAHTWGEWSKWETDADGVRTSSRTCDVCKKVDTITTKVENDVTDNGTGGSTETTTPPVQSVTGLDELAQELGTSVNMMVETKEEAISETGSQAIEVVIGDKKVELFEITISDGTNQSVSETGEIVLEIALRFDAEDKEGIVVYRHHGGEVDTFTALTQRPTENYQDETFFVDEAAKVVYIYSNQFSTYGIAYNETEESGGTTPTPTPTPTPGAGEGSGTTPTPTPDAGNGSGTTPTPTPDAGSGSVATPTPTPDTNKPSSGNGNPPTGDNNNPFMWMMLLACSACVCAGVVLKKRAR